MTAVAAEIDRVDDPGMRLWRRMLHCAQTDRCCRAVPLLPAASINALLTNDPEPSHIEAAAKALQLVEDCRWRLRNGCRVADLVAATILA